MPRTVLIADDDVNAQIIAETLLRLRGLSTRITADGTEACEMATRGDIAVVVLDLSLPGMNGFEVLRRLRSRFSGTPRLPLPPRVLVVTHRTDPEVERFTFRLGADAFLRKPVDPGEFIRMVEHLLSAAPENTVEANAP